MSRSYREARRSPARRVPPIVDIVFLCFVAALLAGEIWCGVIVHRRAAERAALKRDFATVNGIGFGLLSADRWRDAVVQIAYDRIEEYMPDERDEALLESSLTKVIDGLISSADSLVQHGGNSIGGKIKRFAINTFV